MEISAFSHVKLVKEKKRQYFVWVIIIKKKIRKVRLRFLILTIKLLEVQKNINQNVK